MSKDALRGKVGRLAKRAKREHAHLTDAIDKDTGREDQGSDRKLAKGPTRRAKARGLVEKMKYC
jgi:hypothetical protein